MNNMCATLLRGREKGSGGGGGRSMRPQENYYRREDIG